jgi:hypothetical protein
MQESEDTQSGPRFIKLPPGPVPPRRDVLEVPLSADPVLQDYLSGYGTTVRTTRSEAARHRDPIRTIEGTERTEGHHGFPQYLGGAYRQELQKLPYGKHYLYHQIIDKAADLPRLKGRRHYKQLSKTEMRDALRRLVHYTKMFDKQQSTKILPALIKGIKQARPLAGRK